jgi:hypothetical protein
MKSHQSAAPPQVELVQVAPSHSGPVTGAAAASALGEQGSIATCSADGTVELWDGHSGRQAGCLQLGGRLSCLAAGGPWAAAGSESGVVRLLACEPSAGLRLAGRCRLGQEDIRHLAMSGDGEALAAACGARQLWIAAVGPAPEQDGSGQQQLLRPAGCITTAADIAAVAWLPSSSSGGGRRALLAALSDGSLLHVTAPASPAAAAAASLELPAAEAPVLVARLEGPLVSMAVHRPVSGRPLLYGLGPSKALLRYTLPGDAAGWQQAARTGLKPTARVSARAA